MSCRYKHAYLILGGDPGGIFSIVSGTGDITLAMSLDYESATSHELAVTAVDGGSPALSASITVVIYITPVNEDTPSFTAGPYATGISEAQAIGRLARLSNSTCFVINRWAV